MPSKPSALKRRLSPSLPLTIEIKENDAVVDKIELRIGFNLNTMARIEEKLGGKSLLSALDLWTVMSARTLAATLWAACLEHSPEYDTRDDDGNPTDEGFRVLQSYLNKESADKAGDVIWEAYLLYLPPSEREFMLEIRRRALTGEKPEANPPKVETAQQDSVGSTSGQSDATTSDLATAKSAS